MPVASDDKYYILPSNDALEVAGYLCVVLQFRPHV